MELLEQREEPVFLVSLDLKVQMVVLGVPE